MQIIIPKNIYKDYDIVLCNAFYYNKKDELIHELFNLFYCRARGLGKFEIKLKNKKIHKCKIELIKKIGSEANKLQ